MSIEGEIHLEAESIAATLDRQADALDRELLALKSKALEVEAKRDAARLAPKRLAYFQVKIGVDYQCPNCWIRKKTRTALTPRPGDARVDRFSCDKCSAGFDFPS